MASLEFSRIWEIKHKFIFLFFSLPSRENRYHQWFLNKITFRKFQKIYDTWRSEFGDCWWLECMCVLLVLLFENCFFQFIYNISPPTANGAMLALCICKQNGMNVESSKHVSFKYIDSISIRKLTFFWCMINISYHTDTFQLYDKLRKTLLLWLLHVFRNNRCIKSFLLLHLRSEMNLW